jgi:RNA polymerase sigma-70 factor (ECF subfamily)
MDAAAPRDYESEYAEIRNRLAQSVRRVCPVWLQGRADDIVQDAVIRVLEISRARESGEPIPSSYLWKVAYSATVDEIRRIRRRPEVSWEDAERSRSSPAAANAAADPLDPIGPEAGVALDELGAASEDCLAALPEARRMVVGFHLIGYTAGEIAASLGRGEKSVRNLLHRGLVALRRCLAGKGFAS